MNSRRPVCHICGGSEPAKILSLGHGVTSDCTPWPFPVEVFDCAVFGNERATGESKALTFRNLASVAHSLLNIVIRRVSKVLYGHC